MSTSDYIRFRVNHNDKLKAKELFQQMGFTLTQAFNVFLKQSLIEGGLPFQPHLERQKIPNRETLAAFREVKEGRAVTCTLEEFQKEMAKEMKSLKDG